MNKQDTKGTWKKLSESVIVFLGITFVFMFLPLIHYISNIIHPPQYYWRMTHRPDYLSDVVFFLLLSLAYSLFLAFMRYFLFSNSASKSGLHKAIAVKVIGPKSVVLDLEDRIIETINESQWFWRWEWKKSQYSAAKIVCPPESSKSFCMFHNETVGRMSYFHWGYNITVEAPIDLAGLNRLKQAIGEKFVNQGFYQWGCVACNQLAEIDRLALLDLDDLADQQDEAKQEQFKQKINELIAQKLEPIGVKLTAGELVFNPDKCLWCRGGCSGCR